MAQINYSGVYYIANNNQGNYLGNSDPDNFYLCPAQEYYDNGTVTTTPNNTPFFTTFQTQQGDNSLWVVEKVSDTNYYTFKLYGTHKYITVNDALTGDYKPHRRRIHLEELSTLSDRNYFTLTLIDTQDGVKGFSIGCHDNYKSGNNQYFNPAGGNQPYYTATNNETPKSGGMVGFFTIGKTTGNDRGSVWFFEISKPIISYDASHNIVITHPMGSNVNIYYTIDGTTPTTSSTLYTDAFLPEINVSQITAIAVSKNTDYQVKSAVETFNLTPCSSPTIRYNETTQEITISSATAGATIYYTIDTDSPVDPTFSTPTFGISPITISNVNSKTTVKDFAAKQGYAPSAILTHTVVKVATPVFDTSSGNSVAITCATEGATIYYTDDDSEPSTSWSVYYRPLTENISGKIFRAFAAKANNITSDVAGLSAPITLGCATPVIKRGSGNTFTLSCSFPSEGVTIYYTTSNADLVANPTSGTVYTIGTEVPFTGTSVTVKAIAVAEGYNNSALAERTITEALSGAGTAGDPYLIESSGDFAQFIIKANGSGAGDFYKVTSDFTVGSTDAITTAFTGTFDGGYHVISGLGKPLFNSINGGTVKNVVLDPNTTVSGNGAICNEASGSTKIYNCGVLSGTIIGSDNVGGLVGHINSGSSVRVVNCYNFATVSGGSTMAGIVGNNEGTVGNVRIAMCMMYGNMSGGTSPVYAGNHTDNVQKFTEYNYWRSKADLDYTTYNDQLAIDKDEYLTRFPFYRHILNTHRELAAFFLFGGSGETVNDITSNEIAEIGHWVLNKDVAPYPVVEEWKTNTKRTIEDIKNNLPNTTDKGAGKLLNNIGDDGYYTGDGTKITAMGSSGYLTVKVTIGSNSYSVNLPITDMNEDNYDYTWGKVVLPFANEFSGWTRNYDYVCTGWEITAVGDETSASVSNYNFADRDNKRKDIYDATNNPYIFAQGGNYIVPYGVSTISINAHFAKAFYLSDPTYEIGYKADYTGATPLGGNVYNSNEPYYHGKKVFTSLSDLVADPNYTSASNPHEQAIVLVGNYHFNLNLIGASDGGDGAYTTPLDLGKAVTIMSTDEDNNQEPDYGWYTCNTKGRINVPPIRFDFLPNIEMGMSSRVGSNVYPGIGIWHTRGWFELTETCVSNMSQCEINSSKFSYSDNGKGNNRWIVNSGCFVQIVRARTNPCIKLSYIQIGGNAYVKELYPGCHSDNARTNTAVPIVVTGGQVDECYMTGYTAGGKLNGDIHFWCAGGRIKKFLGAYLEEPIATTGTTAGMRAKIDHALIGRFFGGGTSVAARIKGNIDVTIDNSQVDFYCGGPEFGDIGVANSQGVITNYGTVTTHATGTTFGEYYGAGFGGTSVTYNKETDIKEYAFPGDVNPFPLDFTTNYKRLANKTGYGIGTCYKFEYIYHSSGSKGVARFHTGYAQFSLATTGNVANNLTNCIIKKLPGTNSLVTAPTSGEFYGAGCQGKVSGTVTSTLTNCIIERNAFGGGYKAESNDVEVYTTTRPTYSEYTKETGIFSDFGTETPETFKWKPGNVGSNNTDKELYTGMTQEQMDQLGNVTGTITLTIDGGYVGGTSNGQTPAEEATDPAESIPAGGSVYGGGNESKSLDNATVTLKGNAVIYGDVFGGGNKADVSGSATVNIVNEE